MANPLYSRPTAPAGAPNAKPGEPSIYIAEDDSFSVGVPPGWKASGTIQKFPPNLRYPVVEIEGPDKALLFMGHIDLPQLYFVPGPWHGFAPMGHRITLGDAARFPSPLLSAQQAAAQLASQRFGQIVGVAAEPATQLFEETRRGLAMAGAMVAYIDACRFFFDSSDQSRTGMIQLVVFGGGNPGDTWQVDFISGYWISKDRRDIGWEYWHAMHKSFNVDTTFARNNKDQVPQSIRDAFRAGLLLADKRDQEAAIGMNKTITEIKAGMLNSIKGRKHGG